jgi:ATP-binding cassette, subfamily B, multidrug efflux pump
LRHFRTIGDFLWDHRRQYALGIFWILFVDAIQQVIPKLMGNFANEVTQHHLTSHRVMLYALAILGLAVFIFYSRYRWRMYIMGSARTLEYALRLRLYAHLQRLSTNYFNHHKTGDLMAHATNDIYAIRNAMGPGIVMMADPTFLIPFTLIMMFTTVDWPLVVFSLLPLPILAIIVTLFGRVIHRQFRDVQASFSNLTDIVQENIAGIRVVKTFVQEQSQISKFAEGNEEFLNVNVKMARLQGIYQPILMFFPSLSMLIALGYGGVQVAHGVISVGSFVAFNSYLAILSWPIMAIGWVINMLQRGSASMERLNQIFFEQPEIQDAQDVLDMHALEGTIVIRDLTFTYPGASSPALSHINLRVDSGQTLAVVGRTGSGKTTLLNLLLHMYNVPRGHMEIDGVDVNRIPVAVLRENIGCVPQDNFLFSQTIRENISFANPDVPYEQVVRAAKAAQVHDNIEDFPNGYDTMLGERGVTLSGGQRQRVSIARAIIKNPKLLLLDDCLSAVDANTEELILENMRRIMENRTTIIVAHRISTVKDANHIVVLEEGKIAEEGTHAELIAKNGLYADMYRRQQLEDQIAVGE